MPTPLTDADKVLRNDTGKDIVTQLTAIKTAIENGGGGSGASTVSQLTDVLLDSTIPDGDVLVRDNNLTGGKLWKNATITVELTQAEYNQLVADDEVLPDVDYYITDAPSMSGSSKDLSYDGTTKSTYTKIEEIDTELSGKADSSDIPTVDDFISVKTVSTTTNSNGFINTTFDTKVIVLCAWATQGDCLIIPFSASSANDKGNNQWWFKVLDDNMQVRGNFSITMYISYIVLS